MQHALSMIKSPLQESSTGELPFCFISLYLFWDVSVCFFIFVGESVSVVPILQDLLVVDISSGEVTSLTSRM